MKTCTSISGGQTSAYIAKNYPTDFNVFSLVCIEDKRCTPKDKKLVQLVSDKIGKEFIATAEDDIILHTILDLEQYIGNKIHWVSGDSFDKIINRGEKKYLPNVTKRFCTQLMKLKPLFEWWLKTIAEPVEMQIGFRANEMRRAKNMIEKTNENGLLTFKHIVGKTKNGKQNKWKDTAWQKPTFPLINDAIYKDEIVEYWKGKPVRFAYMNNCIGCFHRSPILLKHMSQRHPNKFQWFIDAEQDSNYGEITFKNGYSYQKIKDSLEQLDLFDDDFNECDSGYCGL